MADCKVIVAGAGPAGLAAAALLAREGVATTVVAPAPGEDPRTVALMQPSIQLLRYLDIWPGSLESQTSPLRKLRIVDDTGSLLVAPNLEFASQDLNLEAFGWNVPLSLLLPVLRRRAEDLAIPADCRIAQRSHQAAPTFLDAWSWNCSRSSQTMARVGQRNTASGRGSPPDE